MMIDLLGADFLPLTDTGVLEMLRCYFCVEICNYQGFCKYFQLRLKKWRKMFNFQNTRHYII